MMIKPYFFWLFIKEEYRAQSSMFNNSFLMFPLFIITISTVLGLMIPIMLTALSSYEIISLAHLCIFLSGMLVGGFAMFEDEILERRMGSIRVLLESPRILPLSYKEMFTYFYFKDIFYYIIMNILPILLGIFISTLFTGLHIDFIFAAITFTTAFVLGISISFTLTTLWVKNKAIFAFLSISLISIILWLLYGSSSPLTTIGNIMQFSSSYMDRSIVWNVVSLAIFLFLTAFSLILVKERAIEVEKHYKSELIAIEKNFKPFCKYSALVAKEWIDLNRSGGMLSLIFSFTIPLSFLWGLLWLLSNTLTFLSSNNKIILDFNTMFYAVIIGFFACQVYGWLNNFDTLENYKTLPISMTNVIKAKLILFVMLDTAISTVYLTLICISRNELSLLPFAIYTMLTFSAYVGVFTAYLTGIFTNNLMFDYRIMTIYSIVIAPVLIALIVMSFANFLLLPQMLFVTFLGLVAYILIGKIDRKWGTTMFKI